MNSESVNDRHDASFQCSSPRSPTKQETMLASFGHDPDGEVVSASDLRLCCMRAASDEDVSAVVASAASTDHGDWQPDEEGELTEAAGAEVDDDDGERRRLREAFGMYEMEGAGCITPLSLKLMLAKLGAHQDIAECQAIICRFDMDGDGVLSFDEFKTMMMS